jgi:FtsH-binding integral membrane protein
MSYSESQRKEARELIIKSRLYKIVSYGFLCMAVVVFIFFYAMFAEQGFLNFIKNPFLIGMILFPFVPAYVFAFMSKRRRSKAVKILSEGLTPEELARKRSDLSSDDMV